MNNLDTVIAEIKDTVRPLMDRWVEDRVTYLASLKKFISEMRQSDEYKSDYAAARERDRWLSDSSFEFNRLTRMGYTKGDIQLAKYYSEAERRVKTEKDAEQKMKKIDIAVKKKVDFEVTEVKKQYLAEGKDGYIEGSWILNNVRTFSFDTFYAGGHSIQCLHVRTKYKLK